MPKSRIYLPDINVWIALSSDRHVHHLAAKKWFQSLERASAAFCRVTQMGFLRLLTNPKVMIEDVVTQREAWRLYEKLCRDRRIFFAPEHPEIEAAWKQFSLSRLSGANLWTDAYLAAFAKVRSWQLVSFDKSFRRLANGSEVLTL